MRYVLFLLIIAAGMQAQSPAEKLISKSIAYHDPDGKWSELQAEVHIESIVDRKGKIDSSERKLVMNLKENYFQMVQDTTVYTYPCEDCERATMFNNYFRYLLGMPMKLRDDGIVVQSDIDLKKYEGVDYQVVTATYEPEVGSDTWKFYFHPETGELRLTEFSKDGTFQNGETIELNEKTRYQGMLLPGQLRWLVLPDRVFLAEENIEYSTLRK